MDEPIQRIRVFVLGKGDNPLAAPIDVSDPAILQALARLIDEDAKTPRVTPSATRIVRATMRTGVANLQRVLGKNLMYVQDDGRLEARTTSDTVTGKAAAILHHNRV